MAITHYRGGCSLNTQYPSLTSQLTYLKTCLWLVALFLGGEAGLAGKNRSLGADL